MLGKLGNAGAFAVIYIWSAELYPTVVRNAAMGASSAFARIGSMSSPYIADLIPYGFPVYPVDSCPLSKVAWETRSRSLNCSNDLTYMNRYFCMPNSKLTSLVEFCYDIMRPMVEKDYCIVLADSGTINYRGCLHFTDGCPTDNYFSDTVYNYPMCLDINGKKSCFTASPECNETHATSDKITSSYVPSSVYREIYSSFSHFLVTTTDTSSYGDSSNDNISPSTLPIILILVAVLVLLCIALGLYIKFRGQVLQVCKKRNDSDAENVISQEMDRFLSNESVVENDTSANGMRLPETSQDDSLRDDSQGEECDEIKTNIKGTRTEDICNNGNLQQEYVLVTDGNQQMELPLTENCLLKETLQSYYSDAVGLGFIANSGLTRCLTVKDGKILPPPGGWLNGKEYHVEKNEQFASKETRMKTIEKPIMEVKKTMGSGQKRLQQSDGSSLTKRNKYKINIGWLHGKHPEIHQVKRCDGGGLRFIEVDDLVAVTVKYLIEKSTEMFFPQGVSVKGNVKEMNLSLGYFSKDKLEKFVDKNGHSCTFPTYLKDHELYLSKLKLYLISEPLMKEDTEKQKEGSDQEVD